MPRNTEKLLQSLTELSKSIEDNAASVEAWLLNRGSLPDSAIVISMAKYRDALERLAAE